MSSMTPEVVSGGEACTNPVGQRELSLRGRRLLRVENLGVTRDVFEAIDLSDNLIGRLDNFPRLARLQALVAANNRVVALGEGLGEALVALETLVLTGNALARLEDLEPLAALPRLTHLSLVGNPVAALPGYRLYVAHMLPRLRVLDFQKVHPREREEAARAHAGGRTGGAPAAAKEQQQQQRRRELTDEQRARLRKAIAAATTAAEMDRLEAMLAEGRFELDDD